MSLCASGTPCSSALCVAARKRSIGRGGGTKGRFGIQANKGVERGLPSFDARQQRPRRFDRGHLSCANSRSNFSESEFGKLGHLPISARAIAVKLDGSTSKPGATSAAAKRLIVGNTARATRALAIGVERNARRL